MVDAREDDTRDPRLQRRAFLRRGGLVAGGAALGTAVAATGAGAQVSAQVVDYTYIPVGPARNYDSRNPGSLGPLPAGATRLITTDLQNANPRPLAITINLTVTQTVGAGWLAVYPDDVTFGGTSSINWFGSNQDLANNAFVAIPDNGVIRITAGGVAGARAQFIIDTIGASVPIDFSAVSASEARTNLSSFGTAWTDG